MQQLNESATAASGNIASVSNMVGEYHEIGVQAGNEWKGKLDNYSQAASVLGAALDATSGTASGSGSGASSRSGSYVKHSTSQSGFSSGSRSGETSVSHESAGSSQQPALLSGGSQSGRAIGAGAQQEKLGSSQQSALLSGGSQSGGAIGAGAQQEKLGSSQQSALLSGGSQSGGAIGAGAQQEKLGSSQQSAFSTTGGGLSGSLQAQGNFTSSQSAAMSRQTSQNVGGTDNKKSLVEKVYRTLVKHKALQKALLATETVESVLGAIDKAMDIKDIDFNSVLNSPKNTTIEQAADRISESSLQNILSLMNYTVGEKDDKTKPSADLKFFAKCLYSFGTDSELLLKSSDELRKLWEEEVKISGALNAPNTPNTPNASGKIPDDQIKTSIDSKVKAAEHCALPKWIAETFRDGKYKTVEAIEDMTLYRVFGGEAKKQGSYLTTQKPSDKLYSKTGTALKPEWKNTRQYYCEVFIPKGTVINIGLVEEQKTPGGNTLPGGLEQIVVSKEFANNADNYGKTKELGFNSEFLEFSKNADKTEEDGE